MPFAWNLWCAKSVALEHFHHRTLGILERHHVGDRRLGVAAPFGPDALRRDLALEVAEIGIRRDLETEPHALRLRAAAEHHRMMVDGRGQIDRVRVLGDEVQSQNLGVVFGLLVEIGRLIHGVRDLTDADHVSSLATF